MRPAAEILLIESRALRPILERAEPAAFGRPTVCEAWSVRDVLAHCAAALSHVAAGTVHRFTPEDNQADVELRRSWPLPDVLDELWAGYEQAVVVIDEAAGRLDGVGIGEWMHGGDVRDALGEPDAYVSDGSELALDLFLERSRRLEKPRVAVELGDETLHFGLGRRRARLRTDLETFVRLVGGRQPDPDRFELDGVTSDALRLFS